MPAASAACGFSPTARSRRPGTVRFRYQTTPAKTSGVRYTSTFWRNRPPTTGSCASGPSASASRPVTGWLVQPSTVPSRPVRPWQKKTSASPAITWLTRSQTTITANSTDTAAAAAIEPSSAMPGSCTASCTPMPASAPTSISPSAPSDSTPARSETISPSAASANGTAKSGMLPSQCAIRSMAQAPFWPTARIRCRMKKSDDATHTTRIAWISCTIENGIW